MKKIIFSVLMLAAFASTSFAQNSIETKLRKYKNDEGVMAFSLSGDIANFFDSQEEKIKSKVTNCEVLLFNSGNDVSDSDKAKVQAAIQKDGYEMLINVKNGKNRVKVYSAGTTDVFDKVYAQVNSDDMNIYFILSGKIHFDELSKLTMDVSGGDIFKLLDEEMESSDEKH